LSRRREGSERKAFLMIERRTKLERGRDNQQIGSVLTTEKTKNLKLSNTKKLKFSLKAFLLVAEFRLSNEIAIFVV
jgi:hypothetical protein